MTTIPGRRLGFGVAIAILAFAITAVPSAASEPSPTNANQKYGPYIVTIEQTNMCAWGTVYYDHDADGNKIPASQTCYHGADPITSASDRAAEIGAATDKRTDLEHQIERHKPDILTVNEACQNDIAIVAAHEHYHYRTVNTGNARECTENRGHAVNAILAKDITSLASAGTEVHKYFPVSGTKDGKKVDSARSYLCINVAAAHWQSIRVCTAHLSLARQATNLQANECNYLRNLLKNTTSVTLFAGDVNMGHTGSGNCAPSDYHGLKDVGSYPAYPTLPGLQQIYYSAGFWRESCGWEYSIEHTDHKGFLLELGHSTQGTLGPCSRNIR